MVRAAPEVQGIATIPGLVIEDKMDEIVSSSFFFFFGRSSVVCLWRDIQKKSSFPGRLGDGQRRTDVDMYRTTRKLDGIVSSSQDVVF